MKFPETRVHSLCDDTDALKMLKSLGDRSEIRFLQDLGELVGLCGRDMASLTRRQVLCTGSAAFLDLLGSTGAPCEFNNIYEYTPKV